MLRSISKMQGKEVRIKDVAFATTLNMKCNALVSRDGAKLKHEILSGEKGESLWSNP